MPYQVFQDNVQDTGDDGKPKVDKDGKPVFVQDTWSDDAKTPKVDDKGQPIWKQADKIITEDDLKSKDLPLPGQLREQVRHIQPCRGRSVPGLRKRQGRQSRCSARTARSSRWAL